MDEYLKKIIEFLENDNLDKAYELCNNNFDNKDEHIINNIKGVILFKKKELELAKFSFLKAIEIKRDFVDPYKNLFKLNLRVQDYKSAIDNAKKIIELDNQKKTSILF